MAITEYEGTSTARIGLAFKRVRLRNGVDTKLAAQSLSIAEKILIRFEMAPAYCPISKETLAMLTSVVNCTTIAEVISEARKSNSKKASVEPRQDPVISHGSKPDEDSSSIETGSLFKRLRTAEKITPERAAIWIGCKAEVILLIEKNKIALNDIRIGILSSLFGCESFHEIIEKQALLGDTIADELIDGVSRRAIALSLLHLRHTADEGFGISQKKLAEIVGTNDAAIGKFESGGFGLSEDIIRKFPAAFQCEPPTLVEMTKKSNALTWAQVYGFLEMIGQSVKFHRIIRGMSQLDVAKIIGCSRTQISELEEGKYNLAKEKIKLLPIAFCYDSLSEMIDIFPKCIRKAKHTESVNKSRVECATPDTKGLG